MDKGYERFRQWVDNCGSQRSAAKKLGLSAPYVNDLYHERRSLPDWIRYEITKDVTGADGALDGVDPLAQLEKLYNDSQREHRRWELFQKLLVAKYSLDGCQDNNAAIALEETDKAIKVYYVEDS